MSVGDNKISGRSNDPDQIDLIDLVMQLWRGKVTIIVCVVVAIVLAVGYPPLRKRNGHRMQLSRNRMLGR